MKKMTTNSAASGKILVWDIPTRLFHWLFASSFLVAYITSESERWQLWHVTAGYTFGALLVFRIVWGFVGSRYARFSDFMATPRRVMAYLRSLMTLTPAHFIGHNPAGAWAILALLGLGIGTVITGWASFNDYGDWIGEIHEGIVNVLMAVVIIHIAGVFISSLLHKENLARAMVNGYKKGNEGGIKRTGWPVGFLLITGLACFLWALLNSQFPLLLP